MKKYKKVYMIEKFDKDGNQEMLRYAANRKTAKYIRKQNGGSITKKFYISDDSFFNPEWVERI